MPELPEVETIRRQLERTIKGAKIKNIIVRNSKLLKISKEEFLKFSIGAKIEAVRRRAKILIFVLSNKKRIIFHLKMTGRMLLEKKGARPTKHTHLVFELSGNHNLFFEDYRKFGFVDLMDEKELSDYFEKQEYGAEPLSKNFTRGLMKECFAKYKNIKIKQMLMEQKCVAGIGNIYASEICFYAGVMPDRRVGDLKEEEVEKIYNGIKLILKSAIAKRGSSSDAYLDAYGKKGEFASKLKVYGRQNEKCSKCKKGIIKKIKMGSRGTYYGPLCQK